MWHCNFKSDQSKENSLKPIHIPVSIMPVYTLFGAKRALSIHFDIEFRPLWFQTGDMVKSTFKLHLLKTYQSYAWRQPGFVRAHSVDQTSRRQEYRSFGCEPEAALSGRSALYVLGGQTHSSPSETGHKETIIYLLLFGTFMKYKNKSIKSWWLQKLYIY